MPVKCKKAAPCAGMALMALLLTMATCWAADIAPNKTPGVLTDWAVLGPFASPALEKPAADGSTRKAFAEDLLSAFGGELAAAFGPGDKLDITGPDGAPVTLIAKAVKSDANGVVDLEAAIGEYVSSAAYACTLVESPVDQEITCCFASDDWAKVWVNGELVHAIWSGPGRALAPRADADKFKVHLKAGLNRFLVKIDQDTGPWALYVELISAEETARLEAEHKQKQLAREFMGMEVVPEMEWDHTFGPGAFPNLRWKDRYVVSQLFGQLPELKVRWFDADQNEVTKPEKTGRYAAYVESALPNGKTWRAALTFFCRPAEWEPWRIPAPKFDAPDFNIPFLDKEALKEHNKFFSGYMAGVVGDSFFNTQGGAVVLAGLAEAKPLGHELGQLDLPPMKTEDYNLKLKLKIIGAEGKYPALAPPRKRAAGPATVLTAGTTQEAGLAEDIKAKVEEACKAWNAVEGQPLAVLVARKGRIVIQEAFGATPDGANVDVGTKFPLASLTKCHAGLMLAQFIDQGIINLDDPVGKFLPDFPVDGPKAITLRMCQAHTTGHEGHGDWGGMSNPWLDNAMSQGLDTLTPGAQYLYNGMGFDLSGKVMEVVAGKSFFRLMHENFFIPLGQDNPTMIDLGYGIDCTVMDLARIGQLMLNRGSYGDTEFFSEATFNDIVWPRPLKDFFPNLKSGGEQPYNMGLHIPMDTREDPNPNDDIPAPRLFSDNALMHGAASGAVLRVDFDRQLIIAVSRFTPGKEYDPNLRRLLTAVVDSVQP